MLSADPGMPDSIRPIATGGMKAVLSPAAADITAEVIVAEGMAAAEDREQMNYEQRILE